MISIIVPIYGVEKYLPRCIESILNQSHSDFELLLVDDGSPDSCGRICDEYASRDNRIIVIHQSNAGVSAARNAGLDRAKGEFVGFVDPDDYTEPDMYAEMISALESEHADLAICGYNYIDENGSIDESRVYPIKEDEMLTQKQLMKMFSDMPPTVRLGVVNKLFRAEKLKKLRFAKELHSAEDVLFLTEYSKKVDKASFVHKPLYMNTVRQGSATHGGLSIESLADSFAVHDKMYKTIISAYPELKNHSQIFLLDVCVLKYNEAETKLSSMTNEKKKELAAPLKAMRRYIHRRALQALTNKEVYWKTRISYIIK